jgi:hypothetical protein
VTPTTTINVGATAADLVQAIAAANVTSDSVVLVLPAKATYTLTTVNNNWYGPNGLPPISNDIMIEGDGATIERSTALGTPNFRLFYVSGGLPGELPAGSLTLKNLTLQNGVAKGGDGGSGGGGGLGAGGAIFNQGTLELHSVTLTANQALGGASQGGSGNDAGGGGGIGSDASGSSGGGFGGSFTTGFGGLGGANGGGGGGFITDANGSNGPNGPGGGLGGFGGGDGGGDGGAGFSDKGTGGDFGFGGTDGGGGGVGGGGSFYGIGPGDDDGSGGFGGGGGSYGGTGGFGGGSGFGGGGGGFGGGAGASGDFISGGGGGGAGLGGAIFTMGAADNHGSVVCTDCTFNANTARGGAGGFLAQGGSGYGGAIFNLDGSVTLNNCTVAANSVVAGEATEGSAGLAYGGAIYNLAFGNNILNGSAVSATLTLNNNILSNTNGGPDLASDAINSHNTNTAAIVGSSNLVPSYFLTNTVLAGGVFTVVADPQLGRLQNNGGLTPTMSLTRSSPAFGAGDTNVAGLPSTDQRGLPRTVGGRLDLGAFELQPLAAPAPPSGQTNFASLEGDLGTTLSRDVRTIHIDPTTFAFPKGGRVVLKFVVESESGSRVRLGPIHRTGSPRGLRDRGLSVSPSRGGTLVALSEGSYDVQIVGRGRYRLEITLVGDLDADGIVEPSELAEVRQLLGQRTSRLPSAIQPADLDGNGGVGPRDLALARRNLGASTTLHPLMASLALDPALEVYAPYQAVTTPVGNFVGLATPGSEVRVLDASGHPQGNPITVAPDGRFAFSAPLQVGDNVVELQATDSFGQRELVSQSVNRVLGSAPEEITPLTETKDRVWLLDVHNDNYLFRGPEPLTAAAQGSAIDFVTLFATVNQRLEDEGAPIQTLPQKFNFIDVALIFNNVLPSGKRGTDAIALYQEFSTILGAQQSSPPPDAKTPLFTPPLDTTLIAGVPMDVAVNGTTYSITTSMLWQPVAGAPAEDPPTGMAELNTYLQVTAPVLDIAVPKQGDNLTNGIPNLTLVVSMLQNLMAQPSNGTPNIIYFHCMNGHDRTGMVSTAYVLATYGESFNKKYDLQTAYDYGQMGTYLDPNTHAGENYWSTIDNGPLKKPYMNAVRALAYFYAPNQGVQPKSKLRTKALETPLWNAGYQFKFDSKTLSARILDENTIHVVPPT